MESSLTLRVNKIFDRILNKLDDVGSGLI